MLTVNKLIAQGRGLAAALVKRGSSVSLDWEVRQKSRFEAQDSAGRTLAVFLPRGTVVRDGDVLVVEDGSLVTARAAPQPVMVVRHCSQHGQPSDLLRAAYHLGNRHVAVELKPDHLKFEPDTVLGEMLQRMHLIVSSEVTGFEPEGGAYSAGGAAHGHDHDHDHGHGHEHGSDHGEKHGHDHGPDHAHAQAPKHAHSAAPAAAPVHVHGPGCNHGHDDHGHAHQPVKVHAKPAVHDHKHDHGHGHDHAHDHAHDHTPNKH
jgi:urease accessory protein